MSINSLSNTYFSCKQSSWLAGSFSLPSRLYPLLTKRRSRTRGRIAHRAVDLYQSRLCVEQTRINRLTIDCWRI